MVLIGVDASPGEEQSQKESGKIQQALADALAANLKMRQASDVKCRYTLLPLYDETSVKEKLRSWMYSVMGLDEKLFFVALGSFLAHPSVNLLNVIHELKLQNEKSDWIYGIHFQTLTPMQAYFLKTKIQSMNTCVSIRDLVTNNTEEFISPVERTVLVATGLVVEGKPCPVHSFPVLLYLVHLAIGENGERISGKGVTPGVSSFFFSSAI